MRDLSRVHQAVAASVAAFLFAIAASPGAAAAPPGPLVEVDWLKANLEREDLVIVDTRAATQDGDPYLDGHIPGAVHAPYPGGWRTTRDGIPGQLPPIDELERHIGSLGISGEETIVIVPAAANATEFGAATRVYWTLTLAGIDNVAVLNGGYRAWTADPETALATDTPVPTPLRFTADLRSELLISSDEVRARLDDGSTIMLDGRPAAQYRGEDKSPLARLFGRLPGAVHLDHAVFFDEATGRLLADEAAARLIPAEASDPDVEIVSYCNTAHWASINWFVLSELLGYRNVTLFDDSIVGWTEDPNNPVESDRTRLDDLRDWWNNLRG